MPSPESDYVAIGQVRKPQGRRGEVAAEILTDFPDRFQAGAELWLSNGTSWQKRLLEGSWFHKGRAILKFAGSDSISEAETLVGLWIGLPRSERHALPPGAIYRSDLLGCDVLENNQRVGTVEGIEETGAVPLLKVRTADGELLVPFAQEICRTVDVGKKEIRVWLPEGLKELNRNEPRPRSRRAPERSRRRQKQ